LQLSVRRATFLTIDGGIHTPSNGKDITRLKEKQHAKIRLEEIGFMLQSSNLVPFLSVQQQMKLLDQVKENNLSPEKREQVYHSSGIQI